MPPARESLLVGGISARQYSEFKKSKKKLKSYPNLFETSTTLVKYFKLNLASMFSQREVLFSQSYYK
jgi:hypothetical protein